MENLNDLYSSSLTDREATPAFVGVLYLLASTIVLLNIPSVIIGIHSILKKKKVKNAHILSLGITDGVFGLLWFMIIENHVTVDGSISYTECVMRCYFASATYLASCTHIFAICVERVCVICFKIKVIKANRKIVSASTIIFSWMFALILMAIVYGFQADDGGGVTCSVARIFQSKYPITGTILAGIQCGTLVSTCILMRYLIKHMREMKALSVRKIGKNDVRTCLTTVIIVAMGTAANAPWAVMTIYGPLENWQSRRVRSILFMLSTCNSALNPVIYIFRIREYRKLLKQVICCCKTRIFPEQ